MLKLLRSSAEDVALVLEVGLVFCVTLQVVIVYDTYKKNNP